MENASFITNQEGDDLVVSFAIPRGVYGEVHSLTLLRTPKYEHVLDESERGVKVSFEDFSDDRTQFLKKVTITDDVVTMTTDHGIHMVNIKDVDQTEIQKSKQILKKMNFDNRFELQVV